MDIDDILKKDGKDWTREERDEVKRAIKKQGRAKLRIKRKELRDE